MTGIPFVSLVVGAAAELERQFGPDPQVVGAEDGTEDDFGDLLTEAALLLGRDPEEMPDEAWQRFQDAAAACPETTMVGWLAHLQVETHPAFAELSPEARGLIARGALASGR